MVWGGVGVQEEDDKTRWCGEGVGVQTEAQITEWFGGGLG